MFRKLCVALAASGLLYAQTSLAQGSGCGVSPEYFRSRIKYSGGSTAAVVPSSFPASAIDTCSSFAFYYEDRRIAGLGGPAAGFADAGRGAALRSTLCAVVSYVETVFDFSGIGPGEKIRIYVDTSFSAALKPMTLAYGPGWVADYAVGSAYYDGTAGSGVISGSVEKFIKSGTDPNPGGYHGTMQYNLHRATGWPPILSAGKSSVDWYDWSNYYIGTGTAGRCAPDFSQRALHTLGHILGFAAFHGGLSHHSAPGGTGSLFTVLEDSLYSGGAPASTPGLFFSSLVKGRTATALKGELWVNNKANPGNYPYYDVHLAGHDYYRLRLSPGDYQPFVMGTINNWGTMKREFTKGDLEVFLNRIGLPPNPASFSSSGTHAALYGNRLPYSDKMASMDYSAALLNRSAAERLPADYTIVNNTGTSLTIDLGSLTTDLHDADGDPITIMDGSLVNLRGCGLGGNNHDLLAVNAAKNVITYTPRPDYYGRSQFLFNLWDGKEKGAAVLFTIDVQKGTAVAIPKGDNIVLSGDFEEGSEVRMLVNPVNNFSNHSSWIGKLGRLNGGQHFADSHPYDCYTNEYGNAIRKSYEDCAATDAGFGNAFVSFPWTGGGVAFGDASVFRVGAPEEAPDALPSPSGSSNDRYMLLGQFGSLLYLGEPLQRCKVYKMEFDIRHRFAPGEHAYPPVTTVYTGFTGSSRLTDPATFSSSKPYFSLLSYHQLLPDYEISGVSSSAWKHETRYFTYCADSASDILYFAVDTGQGAISAFELVDNISITEMDEIPLSVHITSVQVSRCAVKLSASDILNGCESLSFQWREQGKSAVLASGREWSLPNPNNPTTYEVTVYDGCHTVKATIALYPCSCSAGSVFTGKPVTDIAGSALSTDLGPGYYALNHDIAITADVTFNAAHILVAPGVTISVRPAAILTLDSSHLFTCPDTAALWKGIRLESTGAFAEGGSARIEVRNNSLVEDAEVAIGAQELKAPPAGKDIIRITNSTFNRNLVCLGLSKAYSAPAAVAYPITIYGSLFTARLFSKATMSGYPLSWYGTAWLAAEFSTGLADTRPPYRISRDFDKAYTKNRLPARSGIEIQNIGSFFGGSAYSEVEIGRGGAQQGYNLADNIQTGIYSLNSNVTVNNTHIIGSFKRMVPDDTLPYPSSGGRGILARSDVAGNNRIRTGSSGQKVKLYDCFGGVMAENMADVQFRALDISGSHKLGGMVVPGAASATELYAGEGIRINGNNNHIRWTIEDNTVSNIHSGIALFINNPKKNATTRVINNRVSARNPDARYSGLTSLQYMMQAVDVYATWATAGFNTLDILDNNFEEVFNGIHTLCLWSTTPQIAGNRISLADKTAATGAEQFGISIENSDDVLIRGNTLTMTSGALSATGDKIRGVYAALSPRTNVCANTATDIGRSFEFAQLTPQPGTIWAGNTLRNAWKGFTLGSPIGDQVAGRTAGNKWLGTWSTTKPNTYATVNSRTSRLNVRAGAGLFEYPSNNAGAAGFRYEPTSPASILTPNTGQHNCYPDLSPRPDWRSPLFALVLADDMGPGIPAANSWMAQYSLYRMGIMDPVLRDSIPELDAFINAAAPSRFAWLTGLETALADGNGAAAQSLISNPVPPMGRVQEGNVVVNDVADADGIVSNYLGYFDIYGRFLDNAITSADTTGLKTLASKCPALHGGAVYQARGLLRVLTGLITEYNDDSCRENSNLYRITAETAAGGSQAYSLFPNPNQGSCSIRQMVAEDKAVRLKAYNALGMEVYQSYSTFKAGKLEVAINQVPGLYLICIDDGEGKNNCLRFVIK